MSPPGWTAGVTCVSAESGAARTSAAATQRELLEVHATPLVRRMTQAVRAEQAVESDGRFHHDGGMKAFAILTAAALSGTTPPTTILFVGNSFTFGALSDVMTYRKESVQDLNGDGVGGVPALFKRFADEAGASLRGVARDGAGEDFVLAPRQQEHGDRSPLGCCRAAALQHAQSGQARRSRRQPKRSTRAGEAGEGAQSQGRHQPSRDLEPARPYLSQWETVVGGCRSSAWRWTYARRTTRCAAQWVQSREWFPSARRLTARSEKVLPTPILMTESRRVRSICGRATITMARTLAIIWRR